MMVWRYKWHLIWKRWGFRLFCLCLAILTTALTLIVPTIELAAQTQPPPSSTQSPATSEHDPQMLVGEVVITNKEKNLPRNLIDAAYGVIKTRPGQTTNKSVIQEDINAIFGTGFFSNVRATPEDTPRGVRVTFEVQLNPILRSVQLKGTRVLPQSIADAAFKSQYGSILNLVKLQEGIKVVNKWYQDNGYVLAQIIDTPKVSPDGTVVLEVAEGVIESIQLRFLNREGSDTDDKGNPIRGRTRFADIADSYPQKPGDVFNRTLAEKGLKQVFGLGLFEDVRPSLNPGTDPRKVVVVINLVNEMTELQALAKVAIDLQGKKDKVGALNQFQEVLQLARKNQSQLDEIFTLNHIANLYKDLENYPEARKHYEQVLKTYQAWKARVPEVITLINLGEVYRQLELPALALDRYQKALQILTSLPQKPTYADLFGTIPEERGLDISDDLFIKGARGFLEPALYSEIAFSYLDVGDYYQALHTVSKAYPVAQQSLESIGNWLRPTFLEDSSTLSKTFKEFYRRYQNEIGQTASQLQKVVTLTSYQVAYARIGDGAASQIYGEQAAIEGRKLLEVWQRAVQRGKGDEIDTYVKTLMDVTLSFLDPKEKNLEQITVLIRQLGELSKPIVGEEGLQLFASGSAPGTAGLGKPIVREQTLQQVMPFIQPFLPALFSSIGSSDDDEKSVRRLDQTLQAFNRVEPEFARQVSELAGAFPWVKAFLLQNQGSAYFRLGRYPESLKSYLTALDWLEQAQSQPKSENSLLEVLRVFSSFSKPSILLALGKVYESLNQPENARTAYQNFLQLPAMTIKTVSVTQTTLRKAEAYYGIARAERALGNLPASRANLDLAMSNSDRPPASLRNAASSSPLFASAEWKPGYGYVGYTSHIALVAGASSAGWDASPAPEKPDPTNPCNTLSAYFACRQKYFEFAISSILSSQQPALADQIQAFEASERTRVITIQAFRSVAKDANAPVRGLTRPAKLAEIQQILDENTLLLEYFLGEEKSYLWAVSKTAIKTYFLPGSSTIEAKAQEFYDLLISPPGRVRPKTTAKVGKDLSKLILGPVANDLRGKRLLIVGDGILQYIPFTTLPEPNITPGASPSSQPGEFAPHMQPLLVDHEVINLVSASAIVEQRQKQQTRPTPSLELAIFADPVFSFDDPRAQPLAPVANPTTQNLPKLLQTIEPIYTPLPGSQEELKQIAEFVPRDRRSEFLGFAANHETAISKLKPHRIVHFASHGFFNVRSPERSGVVLSAIRTGGSLQRSAITPADTLDMDLSATDLVVLSGCRTALGGKLIREGLTGLTGGLMSAGAERVVASLWSVSDEATQKLMTSFYRNIYQEKLSPAQALRTAQLAFWQDPRWQTPYNWAAFAAYGEWQ